MLSKMSTSNQRAKTLLAIVGIVALVAVIALGIALTNEDWHANLELQIAYALPGPVVNGCQLKPLAVCPNANLSGVKLSGINLTYATLSGANLNGADLSNARLSGAILSGARLVRAKLNNANLSRADLSGARMYYGELRALNLAGANLRGALLYCDDLAPDSIYSDTKTSNGVVVNSYSEWRLKCKGLAFPFASDGVGVTIPCGDAQIARTIDKEEKHTLALDYEPLDLVDVGIFDVPIVEGASARMMRYDAAAAYAQLVAAARMGGHTLQALSGYRSYARQDVVFAGWVKGEIEDAQKVGQPIGLAEATQRANRYSAIAGHSEHQLGTVMDVSTPELGGKLDEALAQTDAGRWLAAHAHEFGFAISYPENKENLTGYQWEPWHLRWIGMADATELFKQDYLNPNTEITLARYLAKKMTLRDCSTIQ